MSYTITVIYRDEYDNNQVYVVSGDKYLIYDDAMIEPILVRRILKFGITIGNITEDGNMSRKGITIPAHMIKYIQWHDTLIEDEKRRRP